MVLEKSKKDWLGIWGIVIGVCGLLSSFYFYNESVKSREPFFLEEPIRSLIVEAESMKSFPLQIVSRDGKPVEKDISSIRAYFWNDGAESIKRDNILKNIYIQLLSDDVEIIDVKILKTSRPDIVKPQISLLEKDKIGVDFDILESDDGFSMQILYAGDSASLIQVGGVVEGSKTIQTNKSVSDYHFYKTVLIYAVAPIFVVLIPFIYIAYKSGNTLSPFRILGIVIGVERLNKKGKFIAVILVLIMISLPMAITYYKERPKYLENAEKSMMSSVPTEIR
ncbi:TPA: hypothetical protein RI806_003363 [Vibrio cholerae]|nr:hypothetical protein [Vibrio cholerae]HDV5654342.1 hypothetical protein [Vibrio cholerae]